jgi:adenine-specific DNA-methyltransferase
MRKENTTGNIVAKNRNLEVLKENFPQCFDKNGDFDFVKFQKELQNQEIDFSQESYGMDWLGKSYARLLASDEATTLIQADQDWNNQAQNQNSENLLLKGDNLEVLKHLSNAYYQKIKMIYIDPPYNTGSDGFVYEDDRKFTVEQFSKLAGVDLENAKKILNFVKKPNNSHSAWLTFMYPRLYIARQLLRDDGVIFISIDDNEVAQLRILMDEIFGEENFVGDLLRKTRTSTNHDELGFNSQHENCLIFAKNKLHCKLLGKEKTFENYSNIDDDPSGDWISDNPVANLDKRTKINNFPITNPYTNKLDIPSVGNHWRFSKESMEKMLSSGKFVFKKNHKENERGFVLKRYKKDLRSAHHLVNSLDFANNKFLNQVGTRERNGIFNSDIFDYPKPSIFIKDIIAYSTQDNDIILDFFAGSGTTAEAVMQLNADNSAGSGLDNRKFILVQLPELIDSKKSKTAYDFVKDELGVYEPTIFEITKERLIRAAAKIGDKSGFKIFETMPIWENYALKADELNAQVQLFDESTLSERDMGALLTTWSLADGVDLTMNFNSIDLGDYIGYYVANKLYLMASGFETKHLKNLIEKIDIDSEFSPNLIIAFGYNFESKMLREIAENCKNYANKKEITIDCIVRY